MDSKKDMTIIVNGVAWPAYSTLKPKHTPNDTDTRTLDGTMYTDFINNLREWAVAWDKLKESQWQQIFADYMAQYNGEAYAIVEIPAKGIVAPMKIVIDSDPQIRWNGVIYQGMSVTLKEQYPIS